MVTRYERVVLELEDRFSRPTLQAAAASKTLDKSLNDLDGTSIKAQRSVTGLEKPMVKIDRGGRLADRSINQLTGRLRLLLDVVTVLGPALVPLGAGGAAAVAGLAAQFGALAGGIGVSILALNGVGDALKAVKDYQLDPTADNLAKVAEEFERLGPAGAEFVLFLESISPQLREMQMLAREGFLPGLAEGIDAFLGRGTQLNNIVSDLATALGDLSTSAGESLGGGRFNAFFDYLDSEAGPLLLEFGRSIGFIAEGLANMLVAFAPASSEFSSGLEDMTRRFAEWSAGLGENDSFQEFLSYIRENGPAAIDFLGSFVDALAGLVEAAAPVGQAILPALTALLDIFAGIAGSPVGSALLTAAAGFVALNRASKGLEFIGSKFDALTSSLAGVETGSGKAATGMSKLSKAAGIAGLAIGALALVSEMQEKFDGLGTGVEQLTGQLIDLAATKGAASLTGEFSDLEASLERFTDPNFAQAFQTSVTGFLGAESWDSSEVNKARAQFELLDEALVNLVATGGADMAQASFDGLVSSMGLTEDQVDRLRGVLPGYKDALAATENEAKLAGDAHTDLAGDLDTATSSAERLQNRLKAARTELKESRQSARDVAESFVNLGDSLNDSDKSLGEWLRQLERNAAALRAFQSNAERAARRGLDEGLIASLRAAGSEGALRMRQLANGTESEIGRANKAWRSGEDAVKDFVNEVGGVKPKYVTRLEARVEQALADLARLRAQLDIPDEYVNVWVTRRVAGGSPGMGPVDEFPVRRAQGGTVPGPRYPYRDSVHTLLAPFEEVVANDRGQADRHRALLKAVNSGNDDAVLSVMRRYEQQTATRSSVAAAPTVHVAGADLSVVADEVSTLRVALEQQTALLTAALAANGERVAEATGAPLTTGSRRAAGWGG